jgi:hypothetical protein
MTLKAIIFVAFLIAATRCHVCEASIGGDIAASIGNGIKNLFISMGNFIVNTFKNIVTWIVNHIKNFVSNLVSNLTASISIAGKLVAANANSTLNSVFGGSNSNASKYLMAFMYTGELPEEYYLRAVDVADEDLHMEDFLFRSKLFAALLLGIIVFFVSILYS